MAAARDRAAAKDPRCGRAPALTRSARTVAEGSNAAELDEARRFPLCRPDPLRRLFEFVALGSVEVRSLEAPTRFAGFDEYWEPFLGGQGPAPGYVASLSGTQREALRARLEQTLPRDSDGGIPLTARAWAVRARKPQ